MDLQPTKKRTRPSQVQPSTTKQQKASKKDLLRLQRDIFQLKKSQENESQYVIRKLMAKKEKPQIGIIQQSPLLSRLKQMMPIFSKSNQELQQQGVAESEKIDVRLEQCESSSSSSQSQVQEDEQHLQVIGEEMEEISSTVNDTEQVREGIVKMDIEKVHLKSITKQNKGNQMDEENITFKQEKDDNKNNTVQINFLTYPYLTQEQIQQLQSQNQQTLSIQNTIETHIQELRQKQKLKKQKQQQKHKKTLIQQLNSNDKNQSINY